MLRLESDTFERWLAQVERNLDEILIDHAHCEKKAAGTAMNLLFAYVDRTELARAMTEIVQEELSHFHLVLDLLDRRGIPFRKLPPSQYGRRLNDLVRRTEPGRAVDRLLVAALIEARSCERFRLLADSMAEGPRCDPELAAFYAGLFESEARHHATYVRLASLFDGDEAVRERLQVLAGAEAAIVAEGEAVARMHS